MAPEIRERLRGLVRWEVGLVFALGAVIVFGVEASSQFLTSFNIFYLNLSIGEIAIMALPMTLIIVTGEIDLSVASVVGLSSVMVGRLHADAGLSIPTALVLAVLLGVVCGAFNGYLVAYVGLPSLAVTIGTLALYRGLAEGLVQDNRIAGFPERWQNWPTERIGETQYPHIVIPIAGRSPAVGTLCVTIPATA